MAQALVAEKGDSGNHAPDGFIHELGIFETERECFAAPIVEFDYAEGRLPEIPCDRTPFEDNSATGAEIRAMVERLNRDERVCAQTAEARPADARGRRDDTNARHGQSASGPDGAIAPLVAWSTDLATRSLALVGSADQAAINRLLADIRNFAKRANSVVGRHDGIARNAGTIAGLLGHALQSADRRLAENAVAALADSAADVCANDPVLIERTCEAYEQSAGVGMSGALSALASAGLPASLAPGAAEPADDGAGYGAMAGPPAALASPAAVGGSIDIVQETAVTLPSSLAESLAEIVAKLTTLPPESDPDAVDSRAEAGSPGSPRVSCLVALVPETRAARADVATVACTFKPTG